MKTKTFVTGILVLSAVIVSACTGGLPGSQSSSSSGVPWKFYVLGVRPSYSQLGCPNCPAKTGWQYAIADLAVENITNAPLWFPGGFYAPGATGQGGQNDNAELVDTGGFQRDGRSSGIEWNRFGWDESHEHGFVLWPNFRVRFSFWSQIPQNQSLAKLTLKFGGNSYLIDLQKPNANVKTPFDIPPTWKARNAGDSIEITKDVRATITWTKIVDAGTLPCCQSRTEYKGKTALEVLTRIENTGGYDLKLDNAVSRLYAFDEQGHLAVGYLFTDNDIVSPGSVTDADGEVLFPDSPLGTVQPSWFVICLSSNPTNPVNKQTTPTQICEIYQVKK